MLRYKNIFRKCGLDFVCVDADSGAIGGAASQEFMVTAESGEDLILISSDGKYGANQEKAVSIIEEGKLLSINKPSTIKTPNQKSSYIATRMHTLVVFFRIPQRAPCNHQIFLFH